MKLADAGHTIALLTLTRGDAGLWLGKDFGRWSKEELGTERAKEWAAAVATIGYHWSRLLRYPDGGLKDAPADVLTADIVAAIREVRPEIVCTFGPEGAGSEHDDHRSASYFAARAFARAALADQYPIDVSAYEQRKAAAFECHKTQHKDRDFFYDLLKRRAGKEYFHLAIDRTGTVPRSDDLLG
jgi:LmbE family N-acetylglucosaminyl deacetylase